MKKIIFYVLLAVSHQLFAHSIEGDWLTPQTDYHPKMVVRLSVNHHVLYGQVQWLDKNDKRFGVPAQCIKCKKSDRNKPLQNIVLLWRLRQAPDNNNIWTYGKVLAPSTGQSYMVNIHHVPHEQKLKIQAYWGLPILGKSFEWKKLQSEKYALHPKFGRTYDTNRTLTNPHMQRRDLCSRKNMSLEAFSLSSAI